MTKSNSLHIKALAILMMLWGHLFNKPEVTQDLINILPFINGVAFSTWLTRAFPIVPFFLFISGFGMYIATTKDGGDVNRFNRIFRILFIYWFVTIIFITMGYFKDPNTYPGSQSTILNNFLLVNTTYNTVMWFLFPYVVLAACAKWIIKLQVKVNPILLLLLSTIIGTCAAFWMSKNIEFCYSNRILYLLLQCVALLPAFLCGSLCAQYNVFEKLNYFIKKLSLKSYYIYLFLLVIIILKASFHFSIINQIYVFLFIFLFLCIRLNKFTSRLLSFLGKYSMTIWMVHNYFYDSLFHDFIYGFKIPIIIFIVLLALSVLSSILIQNVGFFLFNKIQQKFASSKIFKKLKLTYTTNKTVKMPTPLE